MEKINNFRDVKKNVNLWIKYEDTVRMRTLYTPKSEIIANACYYVQNFKFNLSNIAILLIEWESRETHDVLHYVAPHTMQAYMGKRFHVNKKVLYMHDSCVKNNISPQ